MQRKRTNKNLLLQNTSLFMYKSEPSSNSKMDLNRQPPQSLATLQRILDHLKQHLYQIVNDQNIEKCRKEIQIVLLLRFVNIINSNILSKEKEIRMGMQSHR